MSPQSEALCRCSRCGDRFSVYTSIIFLTDSFSTASGCFARVSKRCFCFSVIPISSSCSDFGTTVSIGSKSVRFPCAFGIAAVSCPILTSASSTASAMSCASAGVVVGRIADRRGSGRYFQNKYDSTAEVVRSLPPLYRALSRRSSLRKMRL